MNSNAEITVNNICRLTVTGGEFTVPKGTKVVVTHGLSDVVTFTDGEGWRRTLFYDEFTCKEQR